MSRDDVESPVFCEHGRSASLCMRPGCASKAYEPTTHLRKVEASDLNLYSDESVRLFEERRKELGIGPSEPKVELNNAGSGKIPEAMGEEMPLDQWLAYWRSMSTNLPSRVNSNMTLGGVARFLATIDRLREENERLKSGRYERGDLWNEMTRLRAENERLKQCERGPKACDAIIADLEDKVEADRKEIVELKGYCRILAECLDVIGDEQRFPGESEELNLGVIRKAVNARKHVSLALDVADSAIRKIAARNPYDLEVCATGEVIILEARAALATYSAFLNLTPGAERQKEV